MKKLILTTVMSFLFLALYTSSNAVACDPNKAQTTEAVKTAGSGESCCSTEKQATASTTAEAASCCSSAKEATAIKTNSGCNTQGTAQSTKAAENVPGDCRKQPAGLRAEQVNERKE
jgi:hypothetical protein